MPVTIALLINVTDSCSASRNKTARQNLIACCEDKFNLPIIWGMPKLLHMTANAYYVIYANAYCKCLLRRIYQFHNSILKSA